MPVHFPAADNLGSFWRVHFSVIFLLEFRSAFAEVCNALFISNSRRFIFFHIPKSAGSSIMNLLHQGCAWNDLPIGGSQLGEFFQKHWTPEYKLDKHTLPHFVRKVMGPDLFDSYFKFVLIRDPVDRFRSAAQFMREQIASGAPWILEAFLVQKHIKEIEKIRSVHQFLHSNFLREILASEPTEYGDIARLFQPQSIYCKLKVKSRWEHMENFQPLLLDPLANSLAVLSQKGVVRESEITDSNILDQRFNTSSKTLPEELGSEDLEILRVLYNEDYKLIAEASQC